jgi:hypothetical protein
MPNLPSAVGYGSKTLTLSSGIEIKIPKVVRNVIASRLISSYIHYCIDEGCEYLCRAILFKIITVCSASYFWHA